MLIWKDGLKKLGDGDKVHVQINSCFRGSLVMGILFRILLCLELNFVVDTFLSCIPFPVVPSIVIICNATISPLTLRHVKCNCLL